MFNKRNNIMKKNINIDYIKDIYSNRKVRQMGDYKDYAVTVPFFTYGGNLCTLVEKRTARLKHHSGEICFPGGAVEPNETYVECAMRETNEEIGITYENMKIIGEGDIFRSYASYNIYPFLCEFRNFEMENLKLSPHEVENVIILPWSFFFDHEPYVARVKSAIDDECFPYDKFPNLRGYKWRKGEWKVPVYEWNEELIWGVTARIIHNVVKTLQR